MARSEDELLTALQNPKDGKVAISNDEYVGSFTNLAKNKIITKVFKDDLKNLNSDTPEYIYLLKGLDGEEGFDLIVMNEHAEKFVKAADHLFPPDILESIPDFTLIYKVSKPLRSGGHRSRRSRKSRKQRKQRKSRRSRR